MVSKIEDALEEELIERNWELQRRFIHEVLVELDLEGKVPIDVVMCSQDVALKWLQYVSKN